VEEKPEVRKAGGVYYTPAYIVDYIVERTVGRLLTNRSPAQAAKLRILDPACGSGSFLIGAYQRLLDWHRDQYVAEDPEKHARGRSPRLYRGSAGEWRLTTAERKRILLNNIYGVDIDPQAVEVSKLSLLLKVLEGESKETVNNQLRLFHERALPDLGRNIKCGNSLIGRDFYERRQKELFDEETAYRINAFDWSDIRRGFGGIMKAGGFDAVIGNPPYLSIQTMNEVAPSSVGYYNDHYDVAGKGNYDVYVVFVERGLSLLQPDGLVGFILPSKFFATDYGEPLRELLSSRGALAQIVDFRHGQVFVGATTYTCLLFLSSARRDSFQYSIAAPPDALQAGSLEQIEFNTSYLSSAPWVFVRKDERDVLSKLAKHSMPLLSLPCSVSRGSSTGADDVFMLPSSKKRLFAREGESVDIERTILRVPLYATDFGRYRFAPAREERVIFPYRLAGAEYRVLEEDELASEFPKTYAYLRSRKKALLKRKQFKKWFGFSAPRNLELHDAAHLIVPLLAYTGSFCPLPWDHREFCPMASAGFTISIEDPREWNPAYVLGLLNSRLLFWMLKRISNVFRGGWITCTKQYVGTLPIRIVSRSAPQDRKRHDKMVELVQGMLMLHKRLAEVKTDHARAVLSRQIETTDRQIDQLVYELYGLNDNEIRLVEEAAT
jgi:type I restriction-modification system DNA methylase subunit